MTEQTIEEFARENHDLLSRVLRHGNDEFARAAAWTILDRGLDAPEMERVKREVEVIEA